MKICIEKKVYDWIHKFSADNDHQEVGSMLVGSYSSDKHNGIQVCILDAIEAKYAVHEKSSLTFTHDTWNYVNEELDKKFPDLKIVGWQHTHPGFGVFLSDYDLFIQKSFFDLDFQTAMVVDPVSNTEGFFYWEERKIEKLQSFEIVDSGEKDD